jgi:hypothetical protein
MSEFKRGDRVTVGGTLEGEVVGHYDDNVLTVALDVIRPTINYFPLSVVEKIEPPKPTNQELFDSLPTGAHFDIKGPYNNYSTEFIKVGDDEVIIRGDSHTFSGNYANGENYTITPL